MKELIEIQKALSVPKNQYNNFGNYAYRNCEDILEAVKPLCCKNGVLLTLSDEVVSVGDRFYVKATATVSKDGQSISCDAYAREADKQKGMVEAQVSGSTSSYARKYALNGLFCIDDAKDDDSNEKEIERRGKDGQTRKELEDQAREYLRSADMPEAKMKALWEGIPKHGEDFLRNIANGKV